MTVTTFPLHTFDSAPEQSKPSLRKIKASVGMIPNLAAAIAESPRLIEGFATLRAIFHTGSFSPVERELITLVNAVENGCNYCRAIHSTFALKVGLSPEVVRQLRAGESPADPRLKALSDFARKVVRDRGQLAESDFASFFSAGYSREQALEVLLALAVSTIANYAGHFTHPPLDDALRAQA